MHWKINCERHALYLKISDKVHAFHSYYESIDVDDIYRGLWGYFNFT